MTGSEEKLRTGGRGNFSNRQLSNPELLEDDPEDTALGADAFATIAEVLAGLEQLKAVSPAGLAAALAAFTPDPGYKELVAIMVRSGGGQPTLTILNDTILETFYPSYSVIDGYFRINVDNNAYTANKTHITVSNIGDYSLNKKIDLYPEWVSAGSIRFLVNAIAGTADDCKIYVHIRVYP